MGQLGTAGRSRTQTTGTLHKMSYINSTCNGDVLANCSNISWKEASVSLTLKDGSRCSRTWLTCSTIWQSVDTKRILAQGHGSNNGNGFKPRCFSILALGIPNRLGIESFRRHCIPLPESFVASPCRGGSLATMLT